VDPDTIQPADRPEPLLPTWEDEALQGTARYEPVVGDDVLPLTRRAEHHRKHWYASPFIVIAAVTVLAGGLRFYHLSFPSSYVFDEVYYAKDGCFDAGYPYKQCGLKDPVEQTVTVHPPIGRELIALGEHVGGNRAFGWRLASAIAGTLTVLFAALIAYRLWRSALWAGVAGLLLATESLEFVQSRMSMLDIFVAFFVTMAFLFLVLDRDWIERRTPPPEPVSPEDERTLTEMGMPGDRPPSPILRPWRLLTGLAFGLAAASKWNGGTALIVAVILTVMWERTRRSKARAPHPFWETVRDEGFSIVLFLLLVPIAVYLGSYTRWFFQQGGLKIGDWWTLQKSMANFSLHLHATHPYASRPWTWMLMLRPVAYYFVGDAAKHTSSEVLGIGNPVVFWLTLVTIPWTFIAWIRRQDWRYGFIFLAYALQYLPWFAASRTSFLFYVTPITPFMVLALTTSLRDLSNAGLRRQRERLTPRRFRVGQVVAIGVVVLSVAVFAFFFPVLTGRIISTHMWQLRVPFLRWI
jgi:dolichyl-phosphate-mannose--protein O-mannosyl transferase